MLNWRANWISACLLCTTVHSTCRFSTAHSTTSACPAFPPTSSSSRPGTPAATRPRQTWASTTRQSTQAALANCSSLPSHNWNRCSRPCARSSNSSIKRRSPILPIGTQHKGYSATHCQGTNPYSNCAPSSYTTSCNPSFQAPPSALA